MVGILAMVCITSPSFAFLSESISLSSRSMESNRILSASVSVSMVSAACRASLCSFTRSNKSASISTVAFCSSRRKVSVYNCCAVMFMAAQVKNTIMYRYFDIT